MARRSIADKVPKAEVPEEPVNAVPALMHRPSQAKRKRTWERDHPVVAYRGIPPEVQRRLLKLAEERGLPVGEVAGKLLEAGLTLFDRGELPLTPQLKAGKYTLYPVPGNGK